MKQSEALRIRDRATSALDRALAAVLAPFLGRTVTKALITEMARKSRPTVNTARDLLQASANQQYRDFVADQKPLPAPTLTRFSQDAWEGSLVKVTIEEEPFDEDQLAMALRKGDRWARDAERGTLIDYTRRDSRIDRWARIDPQPPSCPFCTILISRGAIYGSKKSAGVSETAKFHTGCTCTAVLVSKADKDSFDGVEHRDAALAEYEKALAVAGSTDLKELVAAIAAGRPAKEEPGQTAKNTDRAASKAAADTATVQLSRATARRKALDRIKVTSDSVRSYRDAQIAKEDRLIRRFTDQISALKGHSQKADA